MKVWRLCKQNYESEAFKGIGAKKAGGRWNSKGVPVVYTSESLALAALELLVHTNVEDEPPDLVAVWADVPDGLVSEPCGLEDMPEGWRRVTGNSTLVAWGDDWQRSMQSPAIAVPSVVISEERNVLLNPDHPDFSSIKVGASRPFSFDERLFVSGARSS